jgi:hypothetical protein
MSLVGFIIMMIGLSLLPDNETHNPEPPKPLVSKTPLSIQEVCHKIYLGTKDKKPSDLSIEVLRYVNACDALDWYR